MPHHATASGGLAHGPHQPRGAAGVSVISWEALGVDDGGLPVHLPMPVTIDGRGPASPQDTHRLVCWCGTDCLLARELAIAWNLGASSLAQTASGPADARPKAEPEQVDSWPSPLTVVCPACVAQPQQPCALTDTDDPDEFFGSHDARFDAAGWPTQTGTPNSIHFEQHLSTSQDTHHD